MCPQSPGPEWVLSNSSLRIEGNENPALIETAKRIWPQLSSYVRRQFNGELPRDERDRLAIETWEAVLHSISKTIERNKGKKSAIVDLDAYLIGAFQHRFIRAVRKEKRRTQMVQSTSPDELSRLANRHRTEWPASLEQQLELKEIISSMDEWARDVWTSHQYGYSWREIAARYGITEQQAKMRFRYAILKARDRIAGKSPSSSPQQRQREDRK